MKQLLFLLGGMAALWAVILLFVYFPRGGFALSISLLGAMVGWLFYLLWEEL